MTAIRRKKSIFHLSYEQRNAVRGYRFILPWLIGFLVFYAGCLVQLGEFSLSKIGLDAAAGMTKVPVLPAPAVKVTCLVTLPSM